jgi:hypothetical protein
MVSTVTMIDTIGGSAGNIPASTQKVAGYVTGSEGVPWTSGDWAHFPHAGHVRIDQSPDAGAIAAGAADAYDLEQGACTVSELVSIIRQRIQDGITWATVYGGQSNLASMTAALRAAQDQYGQGWYDGHVYYWLANWDLNQAEATALVGTFVEACTCIAVQWASPASNPNTVVPGGTGTLRELNLDLNVAETSWCPAPAA